MKYQCPEFKLVELSSESVIVTSGEPVDMHDRTGEPETPIIWVEV